MAACVYRFGIQKRKSNGKNSNDTRKTYTGNKKAETILKELGISISAAYEMFYRQIIAHHSIPFDLRIPNKNTTQAIKDAKDGKGKKYDKVEKIFEELKI